MFCDAAPALAARASELDEIMRRENLSNPFVTFVLFKKIGFAYSRVQEPERHQKFKPGAAFK
jgi:hypothetical protein